MLGIDLHQFGNRHGLASELTRVAFRQDEFQRRRRTELGKGAQIVRHPALLARFRRERAARDGRL